MQPYFIILLTVTALLSAVVSLGFAKEMRLVTFFGCWLLSSMVGAYFVIAYVSVWHYFTGAVV